MPISGKITGSLSREATSPRLLRQIEVDPRFLRLRLRPWFTPRRHLRRPGVQHPDRDHRERAEPEPGAVGRFGIVGGTDAFRKAHGEATLVVLPEGDLDIIFDLE